MKKRLLSILLTLAMLLGTASVLPMTAMAASSDYSGAIDISTVSADTEIASGNVYSISDQDDLEKFAQLCTYKNSYFAGATVILTDNIVLNDGWVASATAPTVDRAITWTPIDCFSGTFDGQDYKISGLYIPTGKNWKDVLELDGTTTFGSGTAEYSSGLFCTISGSVTIKNLKFENCYVNSGNFSGILAGVVNNSLGGAATIENVTTATVTATSTNGPAGGIVGGQNLKLTIKNCTSASTVSVTGSGKNAGGIIGQSWNTIYMDNCVNTGDVTATGYAGGMVSSVGGGDATKYIKGCTNSGKVSAVTAAGGILGLSNSTNLITVLNCKNAGQVTTTTALAGGILGEGKGQYTISGCENTKEGTVTAQTTIAGGIIGKATTAPTSLTGCTNNGTVNGNSPYGVGGIVGFAGVDFTVEKCVNNGTVINTASGAGGIVGRNDKSLTVKECINAGTVKGLNSVGGIVGIEQSYTANASYKLVIDNCENSSTGNVIGGIGVGGIIGGQYTWTAATEIKNCINRGAVTTTSIKGVAGGIFGKMDNAAVTFTNCVNLGAVTYDRQTADEATASSEGTLGGIIGSTTKTFTITNSANFGAITFETGTTKDGDTSAIGGIVGKINASGTTPTLTDCVSAGSMSAGNSAIGGIVGYQAKGTLTYTRCVFVGEVAAYVNTYFTCGFVGRMDSTETVFNECAYSGTTLRAVGKYAGSGVTINVSGTVNGTNYSFGSTTDTNPWNNLVAINNALINAGVRLNLTDLNAIKNLSKFDWADDANGWKLGGYNDANIPMPVAVAKLVEEAKAEKANGVDYHGVQVKPAEGEVFEARFVSTVDDLNREKIGFRVVVIKDDKTAATYVLEDGKVYDALTYTADNDTLGESESELYTVDGKYLGALVFTNISATGRTVFEVTAFSQSGETKSYDDSYIVVFEDGKVAYQYQKAEQLSF